MTRNQLLDLAGMARMGQAFVIAAVMFPAANFVYQYLVAQDYAAATERSFSQLVVIGYLALVYCMASRPAAAVREVRGRENAAT